MLDKRVRIPMLAGIILYVVAMAVSILISVNTQKVVSLYSSLEYDGGNIFPVTIARSLIILGLYIAFYIIMRLCNGKNNRLIGVIMLIAYCISGLSGVFFNYWDNYMAAQNGSNYLVAYSGVSSAISVATLPFTLVASVLVLISVGRFGILGADTPPEEEKTEESVYYGG
jgi:hypothetical protein